jgi:hypothetical protein
MRTPHPTLNYTLAATATVSWTAGDYNSTKVLSVQGMDD